MNPQTTYEAINQFFYEIEKNALLTYNIYAITSFSLGFGVLYGLIRRDKKQTSKPKNLDKKVLE